MKDQARVRELEKIIHQKDSLVTAIKNKVQKASNWIRRRRINY